MNTLVSKAIEINERSEQQMTLINYYHDTDASFSKVFVPFCMSIFAAANPVLLDDMRIGEMSYTTFYDYVKGRQSNMRKIIDWHTSLLVS